MERDKNETTLTQEFDDVHHEFKSIVESTESSTSSERQKRVHETIKGLEDLTIKVSTVDMFSKNEHFDEVGAQQLKFLLLPYMLGSLWQYSTREDRKRICDVSQIYFKDYLKRCRQYGFIEEGEEIERQPKNETGTATEESNSKKPPPVNPEAKRLRKIKKFKQNQELDAKISAYQKWSQKFKEEEADTEDPPVKDLYVSLIRRAINDSEEQLESIEMEVELIVYRGSQTDAEMETARNTQPTIQPLKPFIITKDALQREVYGLGYPSLPVMTVEELYEQRRATGEWGPPASGAGIPNPEANQEELEAAQKERLEEAEDDAEIERRRQFDEYKDDHRRGWGNRFNRS